MEKTALETAQEQFGPNFITAQQISHVCGVPYTPGDVSNFNTYFPSFEIMRYCMEINAGISIMAGGPKLSIGMIEKLFGVRVVPARRNMFTGDEKIYKDIAEPKWLGISTKLIPGSIGKDVVQQLAMISKPARRCEAECLPRAIDLIWATLVHQAVNGVEILRDVYARTCDEIGDESILVGRQEDGIIRINLVPKTMKDEGLGIMSMIKPPLMLPRPATKAAAANVAGEVAQDTAQAA